MKTYSLHNFEQLSNILVSEYEWDLSDVHTYIKEFFLSNTEVPVLRLLFDESQGNIFISFSVYIPPSMGISIFEDIKSRYKLVQISDEYFVNADGQIYLGQEAFSAYELETENNIVKELDIQTELSLINDPVSIVVSDPIYAAWDERAQIDYQKFKDRKRII